MDKPNINEFLKKYGSSWYLYEYDLAREEYENQQVAHKRLNRLNKNNG